MTSSGQFFLRKCTRQSFAILLLPALVLLILLINYMNIDVLSNQPPTLDYNFVKLTAESPRKSLSLSLPTWDYNRLVDLNFTFKFLPLVCQESLPFLLVLIHSAPKNFEKRKAIRETWGRTNRQIKLVFMLGSVNDDLNEDNDMQTEISEESNHYGDIVQGSFVDSYENLTYKHVMALKYATYHCIDAKYILKTDDDVFVNIKYLLSYVKSKISEYGAEKLMMCNSWVDAIVRRSFRSKYRISFNLYKNRYYPIYCSGWFVLYSPDVVMDLYRQSQNSSYFWIDDVYITGILAEKIDVSHINMKTYVITENRMRKILDGECDDDGGEFMMGRPNIDVEIVRALWKCTNKKMNI